MHRAACTVLMAMASLANLARADDWPMWGYDAARTGVSPETLPGELHLNWILKLPAPCPAWRAHQSKVQFDRLYEPIVADGRLFIGSMTSDRLTAYDTESGAELWRFYADGPVRFAPAVWNEKVYFVSDDGFLYCLRTSDGSVVWKYKGGPSDQKVLGNDRLIDIYPARGAPVIYGGDVYFAASIWPLMGVFIHALDAETGTVVWTNSGTGSMYIPQQHNALAFSGIAPQGYLAATEKVLLVAGGQTVPAGFDRHTGKLLHYNLHSRQMGTKGGGGYHVRVAKDFFVNRGDIFGLLNGKFVAKANDPIIPKSSILGVDADGKIFSYERDVIIKPDTTKLRDSKPHDGGNGPSKVVPILALQWRAATTPALDRVFMKAGPRLYGATDGGLVAAVDFSGENGLPEVCWTSQVEGTPLNMIVADERLFVSTDQGEIYSFSGKPPESGAPTVISERSQIAPRSTQNADAWAETAESLLRRSDVKRGYCLLLGIGSGRLLDELIDQSELHVVALDPDAEKVAQTRRRLDAKNDFGNRVEVLAGDLFSIRMPPYMANLIVSEDLAAAGFGRGQKFCEQIFHSLRPYGGLACLQIGDKQHENFDADVSHAQLARAEVTRRDGFSILKRAGALPGSGDWTHHNGDAANSVFSEDRLVRAPLGILWFGGPSNERVLPRHGHGPTPQIVGGRLFIEGPHMLRAVDVYNGLLLWEHEFNDLGKPYISENHAPGAGAIGGNYVSVEDGVYVIHGKSCYYLDPATGETLGEFTIPPAEQGETESPSWGFLAVLDDVLIGGVRPHLFKSHSFTTYEMRKYRGDRAKPIHEAIKSWKHFDFREMKPGESEHVYLVDQLNRLLFKTDFLAMIPVEVREKAKAWQAERELEEYLAGGDNRDSDNPQGDSQDREPEANAIKRRLLEAYYSLPVYNDPPIGSFGNSSRRASQRLVGLDRRTGEILWQVEANEMFRHNTIAAGNGKVFALDRLPAAKLEFLNRRGTPRDEQRQIIAVDLHTGEQVWHTTERVFGTWLGYSEEFDVLLQAGSAAGDRALDEVAEGMVAYRGADGEVLWQNHLNYSGPCMLVHDSILTQVDPGLALNLLTGDKKTRTHPLTGAEVEWSYSRNRGCNTAIASEHLLTFRSSAAGFYDLAGDSGTGNLGGFRSGCTSNLIPANGVLNAPDYTRTCTCAFQNRTSLALVHMPNVQMWTFNRYPWDGESVRRLGLNFGAPGDCRAPSGLLWLDYPSVGGDSPDVPIVVEGKAPEYFRYHASRVSQAANAGGASLDWVGCSGVKGASSIAITLAKEKTTPERPYTIRLYFADVDETNVGERIFDVHLQGQPVLSRFDIVAETGTRNRSIWKEFTGVRAGCELRIDMVQRTGQSLLCGVELVAEGE